MKNINSGFILKNYDSINMGLAVLFAWVPITALLSSALGEQYQQTNIFFFLQLMYLVAIFNALPAIFRGQMKPSFFFFVLGFSLLYYISSETCQDKTLNAQVFRSIYLWCLPYFVLSFRIKDFSLLFKTLKGVSLVAMLCEILRILVYTSITSYSQESGYDALLPFVVFLISYFKDKKQIYIVFVTISLSLILMSGSRGPLFCAILSFSTVFLYVNRISKKTVLFAIGLVFAYFLYSFFQEQILAWVLTQFTDLSVSTRTIEKLLDSTIVSDDIRSSLRNESFSYAFNHPFIGSGFLHDREYLYRCGFITANTATVFGSYSHFFFAEVLMQFGLVTGSIVLFIFAKNILGKIIKSMVIEEVYIYLVVLTIGLFPLFVSRSWLTFQYFYLILGLLFNNTPSKEYIWQNR